MNKNKLPKYFTVAKCKIYENETKIYISNLDGVVDFSIVEDNSTKDIEIVGIYELKEIRNLVPKRKKKVVKNGKVKS